MSQKFSKSEAIKFGWETTKSNLGFFIGIIVFVFLILAIFSYISNKVIESNFYLGIIFYLIYLALNIIISIGLIKIGLKFCDKEKPTFSDLFSHYRFFFDYLFASIFYSLIVFLPVIILIILFQLIGFGLFLNIFNFVLILFIVLFLVILITEVILAIRFSFYVYLIVDQNLSPTASLKKSFAITKGNVWDLFVFDLLIFVINLLGALCLLVGLLVTIPTTFLALTFVYRKLLSQSEIIKTNENQINEG